MLLIHFKTKININWLYLSIVCQLIFRLHLLSAVNALNYFVMKTAIIFAIWWVVSVPGVDKQSMCLCYFFINARISIKNRYFHTPLRYFSIKKIIKCSRLFIEYHQLLLLASHMRLFTLNCKLHKFIFSWNVHMRYLVIYQQHGSFIFINIAHACS